MPAKGKTRSSANGGPAPAPAVASTVKGKQTAQSLYKKLQKKRQSEARRSLRVAVTDNIKLEALYTAACKDLARIQPRPSYASMVKQYGHQIGEQTLRCRFLELTKSARNAHANDQLLTPEQEKVLVDWLIQQGLQGRPASQAAVRAQVNTLIGQRPSRGWCHGADLARDHTPNYTA
jgi:hypothetical protein